QVTLAGRKKDDAARMGHQYRCARMSVVRIKLLHRDDLRFELGYNIENAVVDRPHAISQRCEWAILCATNNTGFTDNWSITSGFEHGVAGHAQAGINAQNAFAQSLQRSSTSGRRSSGP